MRLNRADLPTLGRPTMATCKMSSLGSCGHYLGSPRKFAVIHWYSSCEPLTEILNCLEEESSSAELSWVEIEQDQCSQAYRMLSFLDIKRGCFLRSDGDSYLKLIDNRQCISNTLAAYCIILVGIEICSGCRSYSAPIEAQSMLRTTASII